jgi:hypothetical protein
MRFGKGSGPLKSGHHDNGGHNGHGHDDADFGDFSGGFLGPFFWPQFNDCWPGHSPQPPHPHQPVIAYRSADGSGNNTFDATLNAAGTEFGRIGDAHFADGISEPLGGNNPRTISNLVVGAGDAGVANPEGVSAFMYERHENSEGIG